ncbi:MAG: IPT/TIG domain-containing protein [Deltaproteobacteria bacterium]|nr:IPT/TIG domain-containing protein [Deltaproteobacteria bacterium]
MSRPRLLILGALVLGALACSRNTDLIDGPAPSLSAIQPDLVCTHQESRAIVLSGAGLAPVIKDAAAGDGNLVLPRIYLTRTKDLSGASVEGVELALPEDAVTWTSQQEIGASLTPELELEPGIYRARVENGSGRETVLEDALVIVPPPVLDLLSPDLICIEQADRLIVLTGRDFLEIDGALPEIDIGGLVLQAVSASGCEEIPGSALSVRRCNSLEVSIPAGSLDAGLHAVALSNPEPAGCTSVESAELLVLPPPVLDSVAPDLICAAQSARQLVLAGRGFLEIDGNLPGVEIGGLALNPGSADGCEEVTGSSHSVRSCTRLQVELPEASLDDGLQAVVVTNPDPAGCTSVEAIDLLLVPPPMLDSIDPDLICAAQSTRQLQLTGQGFLEVDGDLPGIDIGGVVMEPISVDGCTDVPGSSHSVRSCSIMQVELPAEALDAGLHAVSVTNPAPAGCSSVEEVELLVVPPPVLESINPDLVCTVQSARQVELNGQGLLEIDGVLPEVAIGGLVLTPSSISECTDVPGSSHLVRSCLQLGVEIPAGSLLDGPNAVAVSNPDPAGCTSTESVDLLVVPPPTVDGVNPDLVCVADGHVDLVISGEGFVDVDGTLPAVEVGGLVLAASDMAGCQDLPGVLARTCSAMTVTLPQDSLPDGTHVLRVVNPGATDCSSEESISIAVVDAPLVSSIEPQLFCSEQQDVDIAVQGAAFLRVGQSMPSVSIGGQVFEATSLADCAAVAGTTLDAEQCSGLVITLPAGAYGSGWQVLGVTNPAPADCGGTGGSFYLMGPPQIASASPATPCDQNPEDVVISGDDFFVLAGVVPEVSIEEALAQVDSVDGCTPIAGLPDASVCTRMSVSVPAGTVGPGDYEIAIRNPGDNACSSSYTGHIGQPPRIDSASPPEMCSIGGTLTVEGAGFLDSAVVSIVSVDTGDSTALETLFLDDQTLQAAVPDPTAVGVYDVIVTHVDGCSDALSGGLDITPQPVVFFVDPNAAYNGINLQMTIHVSGVLGSVAEVSIYPTGQPASATSLEYSFDMSSRIQATVPAGLAPGSYSVEVIDELGCTGTLANAFDVIEELIVAIDRVELPFGWTDDRTGVNIYAPDPPPEGMTNFQPTPRYYLNPAAAGPGALASELRHTAFVSPARATAVVPAGLPVGLYDLIAMNPDGGVGVLPGAFEVTELAPPVIFSLAPASVVNQETQQTTILGADFRNPTFSAVCLQPDATTVPLVGSIVTGDESSLDVEFDFVVQTVLHGSICIVQVTNDDGTYARYSALGITNPSLNLSDFEATSAMTIGRRAPCAVAGEATPGARFVYAIGGDNGVGKDTVATSYYDSVEMAAISPYGDLGQWSLLPHGMPEARSFHACTTIGRYVFVVGGAGGAGAARTVWRAEILDPAESPEIEDVDLFVDDEHAALLVPGRYSYRVSAVWPASYSDNPGGETLASDPLQVQTPDIDERITIRIAWTEVTGALRYRIYRTPGPDMPSGNEVLLGQVDSPVLEFFDDGSAAPGVDSPLPLGALGRFSVLPELTVDREGAGIGVASDPVTPGQKYIYVMGGRDAAGVALDSYERLDVQLDGEVYGPAWIPGATTIGPPRWQIQAYVADELSAPDIMAPGETWVYAGGGLSDNLIEEVPETVALRVEAGGILGESAGAVYQVDNMQPFRAGYAAAAFNNQLFAFGGNQAQASQESYSIELCGIVSGSCSMGIPDPPDLANWNNLGIDLTVPRYLCAGVTVSAFVFLVGGIDGSLPPVPLVATEKTLW